MVRLLAIPIAACLAGCSMPQTPPPSDLDRHIAILPVNNQTGDPLLIAGAGAVERYLLHAEELTVGDMLIAESRLRLQGNGFEVTAPNLVEAALKGRTPTSPDSAIDLAASGGLRTNCLYLEIRRWEADVPMHVRTVTVSVTASLVNPSGRRTLWQSRRGPSPIPTLGDLTIESAYVTAARKVVEEMLAPLHPRASTPP
jgi:hypothetical protein